MTIDITSIVEFIVAILVAIVCRYVIPWLKQKNLSWLVSVAVAAAEQTMTEADGSAKKQYVIEWLAARNIKYDEDEVDAIIEAAVYEINKNN